MSVKIYTVAGILYQKFYINENDITYNDLIKYINIQKNELYDEIDYDKFYSINKVFIKTIVNLFTYQTNKEIKLNDVISCDNYEFTILFSYEYYYYRPDENKYKKIENNTTETI